MSAPTDFPTPSQVGIPRKRGRVVPCQQCGEKLLFPSGSSASQRATVLFCRKCGSRTAMPWRHRWVGFIAIALLVAAAWGFVILVMWKANG